MNGDRDDEEQHESFEDPAIPDNGTDLKPISEEFLLMCWNAFADQIKKNKPRMAVALRSTLPRIFDGTVIGITLSNQAQLEDFNQNTKGELEKFLRREMKNAAIIVDPAVDKTPDDQKVKLYTNDEKFEYLNKKNPLLSKLKEKLNLELE